MNEIAHRIDGGKLTFLFSGIVNTTNAPVLEPQIRQIVAELQPESVVLDFGQLEYITSAGLRMILRLKQDVDNTKIINAQPETYAVLDMTGFTEMMEVEKALRVLSVEDCEVIGQGANGQVYRIDPETIVKVYRNPEALPEINRERELARTAFVAGIPTAIPYDVVRIESGGYGTVFELLDATSFAALLIRKEKTMDEIAEMSIQLLKRIHSKTVRPETMPDMKAVALEWAGFMKDYLPAEQYRKLYALVEAVPRDTHMLHGDYHLKNVMYQNGEVLLIDMDTLCFGHPVFELAGMYNAYCGYCCVDPGEEERFMGISREDARVFWEKSLRLYLGTEDPARAAEVENKAKIIGYTRIMRREIRRGGLNTENGRMLIGYCRKVLEELLPAVDTLLF